MRSLVATAAAVLCFAASLAAQTHTIIALSHRNHTVYEVDPIAGKVVREFKATDQPHEGAVTADGKTIFASIPLGSHVIILDGATFKEKGRIETDLFKRPPGSAPIGTGENASMTALPHGVALNNDGSKLYIGVERAVVPGIVVYDVKTGKVTKKIDLLLNGGHYLQIQPGTDKLYYPHRDDDRVVVLDTKTDKILKIIPVKGGPVGVAFAPNGEVWIHEDGDGSVTVIDSRKDEVVKVIPTGGKGAGRMAVSADGKWAASTHGGTEDVAIIDTAKKEVVATVKVGKGPGFPLFSPDNSKLYVMNSGMGDIAIVDLKDMKVSSRVKTGTDPFGGALRNAGAKPPSQ